VDRAGVAEIGERPEHQPVGDVEHRRVGADPEAERRHDCKREGWASAQAARGIPGVTQQVVEGRKPPPFARGLADAGGIAEAQTGVTPRVAGVPAIGNPLLLDLLPVKRELVIELALEATALDQVDDAVDPFAHVSQASRMTRRTAVTMSSKPACCSPSSRRPPGVIW
jgi:hypothetical protein